jgi:hypothetical protein
MKRKGLHDLKGADLIYANLLGVISDLTRDESSVNLYDLTTASVNLVMSFALVTEVPNEVFAEVFSSYCNAAIKSYEDFSNNDQIGLKEVSFSGKGS